MSPLKPLTLTSMPIGPLPPLSLARIMSPIEVRAALQQHTPEIQKKFKDRWVFCGDVDEQMFAQLKDETAHEIGQRVSAFTSPSGRAYAMLTHQADVYQHRFVLPLWCESITECLQALQHAPYGIMLGNNGGVDAFVMTGPFQAQQLAPLLHLAQAQPGDWRESLDELPLALMMLSALDAIPSVKEGKDVESVSLSVVMPATSDFSKPPAFH